MKSLISVVMMVTSLIVHADDDAMSMNVNKSATSFVVDLAANPTTGFQWSVVSYDKDLLTLSSSVYKRSSPELIGSGGHMLFTFTLNKGQTYPSSTELSFNYARSWEKQGSGMAKKVNVQFVDGK